MKVYQNIEESDYPDKDTLKRVIEDLIPLRKNKEATGDYYDKYLNSNQRLEVFKYKHFASDGILKGGGFVLNQGEIPPDEAIQFKDALFEVIKDDKESFGYIYRLLGQEINRRLKFTYIDDCLIPEDEIEYCINFDVDDLDKQIDAENDWDRKLALVKSKYKESKKSAYKGVKKTLFHKFCKFEQKEIRNEIKMLREQQNTNDLPSTEKTEQSQWEELKDVFKKLTVEQINFLYQRLNGKYMECNINSLFVLFGLAPANNDYKPIIWKNNKQNLRELLMGLKNDDILNSQVEKATPKYFCDKNQNPIKLAKPKPLNSSESEYIEKTIEEICDLSK